MRSFWRGLRTILALRLTLWDRRNAQRGPILRALAWATPVVGLALLTVLLDAARTVAAALPPELLVRGVALLLAGAPLLVLTDTAVRAGQGQGMAAALLHYPLSPRVVHAGEVATAFLSPLVLGVMTVLLGVGPSLLRHPLLGLLAAVWAGLFLVSFAQVLRLVLGLLLRRRFVREVAIALSSLSLLGLWLGFVWASSGTDAQRFIASAPALPTWLHYLPPLWFVSPGSILADVPETARWMGAVGAPALALGTFALGATLQDRAARGDAEGLLLSSRGGKARRPRRWPDRWPLRLFPPAIWAALGKELLVMRRDPFLALMLVSQSVVLLAPPLLLRSGALGGGRFDSGDLGGYLPFFVLLLVLAKQGPMFNQVAMEGRGLLFLAQVPVPRWQLLLGKNAAHVLLFGTFDLAFLVLACGAFGHLSALPFLLGMAAVAGVVTLAVGNVVSVFLPAPWMGARAAAGGARSAQAAAEGGVERPGCGLMLGRFVAVQVLYALLLPAVLGMYGAAAFLGTAGQVAAGFAVASYAALLYVVGTSAAVVRFAAVEDDLRERFATRGSA